MRNPKTAFVSGFFLAILSVVSCATTGTWPWPFYAPSMPVECYDKGQLLGKLGSDGWPDQAMELCKPDPDPDPDPSITPTPGPTPVKLKCIVTKIDDFYSAKAAYEKCESDLVACQKSCK